MGFSEGDAGFMIDGSRGYVSFQVTQPKADAQILHYIRKILGFGSVSLQDANNNTWQFRVRDRASLRKIVLIFNGNLILEKNYNRFRSFVTAFNLRYNENIEVLPRQHNVSLNDAWISGFTDAAGYFSVSVSDRMLKRKPYQVRVRFILAQKDAEKELRTLSYRIDGRVSFQKSYGGHNLSVELTHLRGILRYFRLFPLKTIKRVSLVKFLSVYSAVIKSIADKRTFTPKELEVLRRKMKQINKIKNLDEDKVRSTK